MRVSGELLDRLGDLYQKYAFQMTFVEFIEMLLARLEKRYGPSRARHPGQMGVTLNDVPDPDAPERGASDIVEKASAF